MGDTHARLPDDPATGANPAADLGVDGLKLDAQSQVCRRQRASRLSEVSIPRGSRVLVMVDGVLLAAKVESVGRVVGDEVRVEVFAGTQWPSFVMDHDDFESAYASDDGEPWLDVAVGCTRYRLVPIVAADCRPEWLVRRPCLGCSRLIAAGSYCRAADRRVSTPRGAPAARLRCSGGRRSR